MSLKTHCCETERIIIDSPVLQCPLTAALKHSVSAKVQFLALCPHYETTNRTDLIGRVVSALDSSVLCYSLCLGIFSVAASPSDFQQITA